MVSPLWITDIDHQLLPLQFEHLKADKNFEILIQNINVKQLVNTLVCGNVRILSQVGLYKPELRNEKTDAILQCWMDGIHVLPPRIFLSTDMKPCIGDGRHRINAALYLGAPLIPILTSLTDGILIHDMLRR
ncbi:hypothetical protein [Desertivirga brevis]|uniref:hypothetical protein n=1 Tax=Desertivirga brevis TaxID=2810310 RepID=UPI001A965F2B|nr:hypothetical protein [Pedobacter sp. SYSU D00873]